MSPDYAAGMKRGYEVMRDAIRGDMAEAVCAFHDHYHMTLAPAEGSCLNGQTEADAMFDILEGVTPTSEPLPSKEPEK